LVERIRGEEFRVGDRLPSIAKVARAIGTSQMPVVQAFDRLAAEGYAEKKPGSGTIVLDRPSELRLPRSLALCMETSGHLWGRLHSLLLQHLHHDGIAAMSVCTNHPARNRMIQRAVYSDVAALVVNGTMLFPFDLLRDMPKSTGRVIAAINWESDWRPAGLHGVVIDFRSAARQVAAALQAAGHRHVLVVGTTTQIDGFLGQDAAAWHPGRMLREALEPVCDCRRTLGIRNRPGTEHHLVLLDDSVDVPHVYDTTEILDLLCAGEHPPTAVVSMMDVHVWHMQKILLEHRPERLQRLAFFGYGNTPWRHFAERDFVGVDYDLPAIADRLAHHIRQHLAGETAELAIEYIPPRLIGHNPST
jgi:DNA-binding LacI/PurR family transcriptional regulator